LLPSVVYSLSLISSLAAPNYPFYHVHVLCSIPFFIILVFFFADILCFTIPARCVLLMKIILWAVIKIHSNLLKLWENAWNMQSQQRRCSKDPRQSEPNPQWRLH
jgi:hypothetical protein